MTGFSAALLRGARVRAPRGLVLLSPPATTGAMSPPDSMILSVDGPWPRRQLLATDTAQLVQSLASPQRLPRGRIAAAALMRLILDGVLEVEHSGRFYAGGAAHRRFFPVREHRPPRSLVLQLSYNALARAAATPAPNALQLADRLYRSNTLPHSPRWFHATPDDRAAASLLTPTRDRSTEGSVRSGPWRVWESPRARPSGTSTTRVTYKLYLSSTPETTSTAAAVLLDTLHRRRGPSSCKLGQDVASVLRPDRLVAYFDRQSDLHATAAYLLRKLKGTPAHGVPFTTPLGSDGLISWGADFPWTAELGRLQRERSWRGWVTTRLATALVTARASGASDPLAFALDRVELDGVHAGTWSPSAALLKANDVGGVRATA